MDQAYKVDQWTVFTRFIVGFFVIGLLAKGLMLLRSVAGIQDLMHLAPAIVLVSSSFAFMVWTARKWAAGFFAISGYGVLKTILALMTGRTTSVPHLDTPLPLAIEYLAFFLIITSLTFCYTSRPPERFEAVALALTVVAILLAMLNEPNLLPLVVGVVLIGAARLAHKLGQFRHPNASSEHRHDPTK